MKEKLILLDAGHGGRAYGKKVDRKVRETNLELLIGLPFTFYEGLSNRATVSLLQFLLEGYGYKTHIIGDWNRDNSLKNRVREVNELNNTRDCILISVHSNGFESPDAHGWEVFHSINASEESKALAKWLELSWLSNGLPLRNRGVKEANYYILSRTNCPAVLVENLFSTNPVEASFLTDTSERGTLAMYIFQAIKQYYNVINNRTI